MALLFVLMEWQTLLGEWMLRGFVFIVRATNFKYSQGLLQCFFIENTAIQRATFGRQWVLCLVQMPGKTQYNIESRRIITMAARITIQRFLIVFTAIGLGSYNNKYLLQQIIKTINQCKSYLLDRCTPMLKHI